MFLDRVITFGKTLGVQVKDRSQKKEKPLIEVPYVALLNVQALSFNVNLFSSPLHVPRPSYPFRGKIGRLGKVSFTENAKIVYRGSICIEPENTGCKLQYDPYLFSVACS